MFSTALVTAYLRETQPVTDMLPIPGPSYWANNFDIDQGMLDEYILPDDEFAQLLNSMVNEEEHCPADAPHVNAPAPLQVLPPAAPFDFASCFGPPDTPAPLAAHTFFQPSHGTDAPGPSAVNQLLALAESLPAASFDQVDLQHQLEVYYRNLADGAEATPSPPTPLSSVVATPLSSVVATPLPDSSQWHESLTVSQGESLSRRVGASSGKANMATTEEKDYGSHRLTAPVWPDLRLNGDRKALEFGQVGDPFFPRVQGPVPEDAGHNGRKPLTWGFVNYSANVPEHTVALMSGVDVSGASKQWKKDEARRLKAEVKERARTVRAEVKAKKVADKAAAAEQKRRDAASKRAATKAIKSSAKKKKDKGKERAI
ncbi:hypothetical protein CcaverHIS002_0102010 [Cutaneotrichosporon cavernicola]|nr:hypothetical protein CcaverHIS002_0102010 [Cutaneotrichosporon cavernicola]BEI95249.1 hypothetical protein CcaverHIS631_0101980 [Cutaneotrichosporon cavernicola]BEJ03022.1 hypothetical protein CcaverHIS641_0101970 [Cutaneotrichosporon cavernicola]